MAARNPASRLQPRVTSRKIAPTRGEPLTTFFLAVLALAWITVMVPAMLRARTKAPLISARRYRRRMDLISPSTSRAGRWIIVNSTHCNARPKFRLALIQRRKQRRQRRVLVGLVLLAVATGVVAFLREGMWLEAHVGVDAVLALYAISLREAKRRRVERSRKVHSITARRRSRTRGAVQEPLQAAGGPHR
jgi:hypothetical protein